MKINCECNNEEAQIRWVRGNTQPLAIPLEQEVITESEEIRTEPYYPSESDKVTVYLVGRFKRKAFTPEIDGNVLIIHEDGTLSAGSYHVEVLIEHQDGTRNRSLWCNQVVITESNDTVLEEWDEFKQQEPQARAAIFFFAKGDKGDKGDPFTYEDFTQEQIEDLKKPAVEAAAYANEQGDYAKDWNDHPPFIGNGTTGDLNYWYLWDITVEQYVRSAYAKGDNLDWNDMTPAEKQRLIDEVLQTLEDSGFDSVPTEGSSKPVRSEGIYTALQAKQDNLTFANSETCKSIVEELI